MKVLLLNPNRYKSPPVPPIGLECIAAGLEQRGHKAEIIDLCFSEDICKDIDDAVSSFRPDISGVTVRNVDSVLYHTNEFFLDGIREIVTRVKSNHGLRVVIGGSGICTNPQGILEYLDADFAIAGPGENVISGLLNEFSSSDHIKKVYPGKFDNSACLRKFPAIDYKRYCDAGGIAGFETHKGCSSSCVYCLESNSGASFKKVEHVVSEIRSFVDTGYSHFHLCDSEFNENLEYSTEFCNALKKSGLDIKWAVYMKPDNINSELFRLLKETGVYLITLSVDSWLKPASYWSYIEKFISAAKSFELKIAVDFLTGFPYETEDKLVRCLDIFREIRPDSVGVNTYIRLYRSLRITDIILEDEKLRDHIVGCTGDETLLRPVFYNHISSENLDRLIGGDALFRIEGLEKGVNYSRAETPNNRDR